MQFPFKPCTLQLDLAGWIWFEPVKATSIVGLQGAKCPVENSIVDADLIFSHYFNRHGLPGLEIPIITA